MAARPLLTDTNVMGTLTYNDPNSYSYQEALDTLNLILAMKGVMLVESGNNLRLVTFKELPSMPLRILRGLDATGDSRPGEIVTVVLDVRNLDSKEIADAVTSMLSKAGSIAALSRGRGLIVTDRVSNIQRIRTLLATIDTEAAADRQMKTYTLLHSSGSIIADLLNRTFGVATAPKRTSFNPSTKVMEVLPPDPNDYITAVYDDASRTLVLFGPNERLSLAEELINKFEQKEGSGGDVRIYYPQTIKAEELANVIRQAIPGVAGPNETAASASTKARVIADKDQQRLIVAAPMPGQLEQIEQLINRVDKPIHGQANASNVPLRSQTVQLTKVFRPRAAEATNMAHILTQALTRRSPSGQVSSTASISFDASSQSVVVTGGPNDLQVASDIVSQLETGSTHPTPMQTRFIDVGTAAEAKRLSPLVEQLYRNQVADGAVGAVAHAKILSDATSGRLIVTASEDHLSRIEALVKQLRADRPLPQPRRLQIITLQNARVDAVIVNIQGVVSEKMVEKPFADISKPSILSDPANNRLLVTATEDQIKEIQQIVDVMDIAPEKGRREMQVIPLTTKTAAEIIPIITQLLEQTSEGASNPQLAPRLTADPTGKQIIALAQPKDLERLQVLIRQFDTTLASASPREFKGVELFGRNATDFTPLVTKLYQEQLKGVPEPFGGAATLIADTPNNRIMVSGSEKEIARVEAIIRQLDAAGQKAAKEETRVMRLKMASATEIATLVEKSVNARNQQVRVLVDGRSNSLVVNGESSAVAAAAQIILELDTRPDASPRDMRIIDLRSGDASALAPMITSLFAEMVKDQRGPDHVSQTKVVADTSANRLIVTGPRDDLAQVAKLVSQLDQTPEQSGSARVFKLQIASATMLAPIVSNAMVRFDQRGQPIRKVMISADEKSNSLIVTGGRTDVQDAAVIIERLDGDSDTSEVREKGRELKIIPVNTTEPDALATLAFRVFASQNAGRNITNLLSITPEPTGKRLIVLAPASMMNQIETVVTALDQPSDQAARELHSIDLKGSNAAVIFPIVSRVYEEQSKGKTLKPATLYADATGARLNVWGTREQAETIRQIMGTLETQHRAPRETKVFDIGRLAEAQRLMPLAQQLYKDQHANSTNSGAADAQFISDGRTGRIIVAARQDQMVGITEILTRLQADTLPGQTERETRAFEVGTAADVQRLLPIVQQLYQNHWKDKQETDPPDAQIVGDALAGRIITSGKAEHLKHIESILNQLGVGKPRAARGDRETRVFDLTTANAVELATTVRTLYLDQAKARLGTLTPDTLIMPDSSANRIIATGDPAELEAIEEIIKKLDKIGTQSASARVFKLKFAEPEKVMEILSTALVRYDAFGRAQKRVSISVDSKTRTLIATGDPKELQAASVIIEQLDSSLGESSERKMKLVSLQNGRALELSSKLRQLYIDQMKARPALGVADALILEDATSNQLILTANEGQLALLEQILADLQAAQSALAPRETKMIEIGKAEEVGRLLPLVRQLYSERWRDRAATDPADAQILSDSRNGRFIVTARTNQIAAIEDIVTQLRGGEQPLGRDTRIFELTSGSASELSVTLKALYQEQARTRLGINAADTFILADTGANRIIVTASTNEINVVEDIIKKLDKISTQSASARVFKLKFAEPEKVMEILSTALVRFDSFGRPQKRVSVSVDSKTRTLIATGDPKELQAAAVIIEQLDSSLGEVPERKMKVFPVRTAKVTEYASRLRQLYLDQSRGLPELTTSETLILEDAASGQIILAGTDAQIALIERIADQIQEQAVKQSPRDSKVFDVGPPDEVQRNLLLVQQLYTDKWKDKDASDPPDAQFMPDSKNGRIIVTGRSEHLAAIEGILAKLNASNSSVPAPETRVFDLASSSAAELVVTVKALYQEQLKARPVVPALQPVILADTIANRLIVSGATNELAAVEDIVKKLDKTDGRSGSARVFTLLQADPEQVASLLSTSLVRITPNGRPVPRVSVGTDPRNAMLVVSGDAADLRAASIIIEQMDKTATKEPRLMRVFPLKNGMANDVSSKARQIYQDQSKALPKTGGPEPLLLGDEVTGRLIVTATEPQMKLIEEIVGKLQDTSVGSARQLRVLLLERNSAASISAMITRLYARQIASQDPGERVVVSSGADDRTLVLDANGQTLENLEQLVKTLDRADNDAQGVIQAVHLKKGNATSLAEAVNKAMAARLPTNKTQRVSVTAVAGANSLLINGPTNTVQDVMKIVRELDEEGADVDVEVRIFKLENGNVREIQGVLRQILQNVTESIDRSHAGVKGAPATISVDERGNSLIITATAAHFRMVEKILPTLDKSPERSDRDVQFVWLRKAKASDVVSKVEAVFTGWSDADRPVIEADSMNNSITIIARRGDLAQIQDLISRLDDTAKDSSVQVRLRPMDRIAADQMARMLQNIYPQMTQARVRVVDKITQESQAPTNNPARPPASVVPPPAQPPGQPPVANSQDPADRTSPEVIVAVDKDANALILSGPVQELDNIDRIISDLSFSVQGNESEFRMFPLKEADPLNVARALGDLLKQDPISIPQGQPGQPPPVTFLRAQQPRITVVAEPRTRSVIVRARPTDFILLESLIKQMDVAGQTAQLDFRVVPLTNAPPTKVLPLVQQLVTQLNISRPGEPLSVTVDPRSRGLLVVARDTVLNQVEKMIRSFDTPASHVEAEVLVLPLKKANATQLAGVLQSMLRPAVAGESNAEARELQEQVRRLKVRNDQGEAVLLDLSQPIKIAADPIAGQGGGNRLLITSTPDNLKALAVVVEMMDTVSVLEGVSVRLVQLEHADAATVSQTLTTIFSEGQRLAIGPAGPGAQPEGDSGKALVSPLNVAVDARSNTLIMSGQPETLKLALRVIDDIDKQVDRFVTEVRLFRLKHASATRILPLLQSVFAEGPAVPGTEGLTTQVTRLRTLRDSEASKTSTESKRRAALVMQVDDLSNVLIVAARSDTLPLIADVIDQLDTPAAYGLETVRIYPLNHADPVAIQKVISDLYTGPRSATLRNEDKPIVSIDDRTGSLIVAGNSKSFAIVDGLLQKLDQKLPFDLREIRIIPLENSDAGTLAATMQRLVDARMTQRASANRGAADSLKVIILADPRSNSLLVGGSKDSFELVETLAKELDKSGPALSGQVRIIPLTHADARVVGTTLVALFEQRYAAARTPDVGRNKPVILPDSRSNSLLVAANMEDNRTLDDLLKKLDQKLENPSLTLTVLPLKHNDSAKVATMIESLFAARMRAQVLPGQAPIPADQVKVEPDPLNNALIVSANRENVELIQSLLQKIDSEPVIPGGVFETFTLQFADAQRVLSLLKSLVDQGLYRPGLPAGTTGKAMGRDALALSVDSRSNTLIVSASPENLALVREVIRRVDNKDFTAGGDVRLYSLKHARASTLAATLTQFFQAKKAADTVAINAGEKLVPVSVIPDDRVNMLVVTGGREAFDTADRVIQQLDGEGVFSRLNFRVFPLKKATATKLQSTLQPIFANRPPKVKGEPLDPITIVADAWVNALLVGASVEDMTIVESLLASLDSEPADVGLSVHVFPLVKADARRVAATVQSIYREGTPGTTLPIAVSADERMNAIVVSAGEVDVKRIGELVKKLDTDQVARVSEIRVFALRYARAESLATILTTSLNTKPTPLSEQSPNAQSVLQFITQTERGQELVTSALKEAVLITAEPRENSLIVSAPVDYMGLLEQIITRLDNSSHRKAKIKVFNLVNADARQTSELLTAMFHMQATPGTGSAGMRSIQYTLVRPSFSGPGAGRGESQMASAVLGTDEQTALTVSIDARTNSLLVGGTEDYVELVSQIIDSLDSSPAQERKTEVVRLRNAQASDVSIAVRTFLDQERQKVTQVLGIEASGTAQRMLEREIAVVPEPTSNTLLLSASPRYFEQIRSLIDELDQAQPQVLIQVLIAEVSLDDGLDLGLEWTYNSTPFAAGVDISASKWITSGFSSAVTGGDYSFLFRALQEKGRLEVLSRPQIVTADNKPALINVGQTIPLITDSRVTPQGDTINSFRYENVGVNLKVTPRIAPDGFVKMEVGTTNSTISSSTVQINRNAEVPILNQRIASTTVSVQSGQSILIGGLIGTTDDKRVRKVPWLGDIPGLGYLFRTSRVKKERRELLILLTPQVLTKNEAMAITKDTREMTDEQLRSSRIKDEIKRDQLQNEIVDPLFPSDDPRKSPRVKLPPESRNHRRNLDDPGI